MILPIYTYGQGVLRRECEEIEPGHPGLEQLIADMWETLAKSEGIGLAAPQVGQALRLAVIDLRPLADDFPEYTDFRQVYINPYIEEYDETEKDTSDEGCLSLPGLHEKVTRPTRIRVSWQDESFAEHEEWVTGYLARVMQHEFDHLDGVLYTDRVKGLRRQLLMPKLQGLQKGKFSCSYKVKAPHK